MVSQCSESDPVLFDTGSQYHKCIGVVAVRQEFSEKKMISAKMGEMIDLPNLSSRKLEL
jgi:hypothetical protein